MSKGPGLRNTALVVAALALLALSACGDESDGSEGSGGDQGSDMGAALSGNEYVSTGRTTDGADDPLVADTQIRLTFSESQVAANAGCNHLSGMLQWDGSTMLVDGMAGTEMGCSAELMAQDDWLARFLTSSPTVQVDGDTVTLTSGATSLELVDREVAIPDAPLEGPLWVLTGIGSGSGPDGAMSSVPGDVRSTLLIEDGNVALRPGCNTGGGSVEVGDTTLTFGPIMTTQMFCEGPKSEVESSVLQVLQGVVDYTVQEHTLTLTKGENSLVYTATER